MPKPCKNLVRIGFSALFQRASKTCFLTLSFVMLFFIPFLLKKESSQNLMNGTFLASRPTVETKRDLVDIDVSKKLDSQDWDMLGIDSRIKQYKYKSQRQPGFVSNLSNKKFKEGDKIKCSELQYDSSLEYYKSHKNLQIDFLKLRRELLEAGDIHSPDYAPVEEKNKSEKEIIEKRWFAFGTAPVWLKDENCYVAYTRIIYTRSENRNNPFISLIYGQAYDKDWNELHDKRIFFKDVQIPPQVKKELEILEKQLALETCNKFEKDSPEYFTCTSDIIDHNLKLKKKIDNIYDKYSVKYPRIMDIPFITRALYSGPEDPHVILKQSKYGDEPIIIFNMDMHKGRRMHAYMPHRKNFNLINFDIDHATLKKKEKNWAPFFYPDEDVSNKNSPGFINFVYDFNPIEILRCSLLTGHCRFVFKASALQLESGGTTIFRGGSQFVPLPDVIPQVKGKNMWLGFLKAHAAQCGCGKDFYRPAITLLVEESGTFNLEIITPNLEFGDNVLSWDLKTFDCKGINILSPNSIANWVVASQDPRTNLFEDYLMLTASEADAVSRVTYVRGLLNYIIGIYENFDINESFELAPDSKEIVAATTKCAMDSFIDFCKKYELNRRS